MPTSLLLACRYECDFLFLGAEHATLARPSYPALALQVLRTPSCSSTTHSLSAMSTTPSSELSKRDDSFEQPPLVAHPRAWGPNWFRHPYFQTVLIGLCAFTAPGIWSAISATGAGGTLEA